MSRNYYAWITTACLLLANQAAYAQPPATTDSRASQAALGRGQQASVAAAPSGTAADALKPTITRQQAFAIPFSLSNPPNSPPPSEVQLFASVDRGTNWQLYDRQQPDARRFRFKTNRDGEYWFLVRTVDANGQTIGQPQATPELIVIVDTVLPTLELTVTTRDFGEIHAEWVAGDLNLAAHTFRLQYQDDPVGPWHDVEVDLPDESDRNPTFRHTADWWLRSSGQEIIVRAEILDRAGNQALATEHLYLDRIAQREPGAASRDRPAADGYQRSGSESDDGAPRTYAADAANSLLDRPSPWPAVPLPETSRSGDRPDLASAELRPRPSRVPPPVANQAAPQPSIPERDPTSGRKTPSLTRSEQLSPLPPRVIASPQFQIDYDLLDVAPADVVRVELWFTTDEGRTWQLYPEADPDNVSPMNVDMGSQGLFGFRLAVHSRLVPARPPQDGDPADIWLVVDDTPPRVRLTDARFGEGLDRSSLVIQWEAADPFLAEFPIALKFSEYPGGPWSSIATGLPNSGQYTWRLDSRSPRQIYLRLEAHDMANNMAFDELARPIQTEGHTPKGRILDLRPLPEASRRPTMR